MNRSSNTVELLGHYGNDEIHALSAWTSTSRDLSEEKKNRVPDLLKMLAENGHHTPFEKSYLHFLVTCDTASHIHLLKHRVGVSINAESARYKELKDDKIYIPSDWPDYEQEALANSCNLALNAYHNTLDRLTKTLGRKRAKESTRFYIPYASQITMDVGFNFRSFMHFQNLRNSEDAQKEIRDISELMLTLVKNIDGFSHSLAAFGYA